MKNSFAWNTIYTYIYLIIFLLNSRDIHKTGINRTTKLQVFQEYLSNFVEKNSISIIPQSTFWFTIKYVYTISLNCYYAYVVRPESSSNQHLLLHGYSPLCSSC